MSDSLLRAVKLRLPDGGRRSESSVWNTSLGGVFVEMKDPLPFGAEVDLEFVFPRDTDNVKCGGFVVWSSHDSPEKSSGREGSAIRLMNIGIAEMRRLADIVGRRLD